MERQILFTSLTIYGVWMRSVASAGDGGLRCVTGARRSDDARMTQR